jgi:hypothetical protein
MARQEYALLSGTTIRALCDCGDCRKSELEFREDADRLLELSLAAVDEEQVRQRRFLRHTAPITTQQRLSERAVVIAALDILDVVAAVFGLNGARRAQDDAGCIGRLPLGVAHVEALDAGERLRMPEMPKFLELLREACLGRLAHAQRSWRSAQRATQRADSRSVRADPDLSA